MDAGIDRGVSWRLRKKRLANMRKRSLSSPHVPFLIVAAIVTVFATVPVDLLAQSITGESVKSAVENYVRKSVPPSVDAVIEFKDLKQSYSSPQVNCSLVVSSANSVNMKGLVTFLIKAVSPQDNVVTIPVTVKIRTFQNVVVAAQTIQPHCVIEAEQVTVVKTESTEMSNPVTNLNQLKSKWTSRWIQSGKALTLDMFDDEPMVKRGDDVVIIVKTKNVVVREQGSAMQDGKLNDVISVINEYRDNLHAKVTGKGEVALVN